MEELDTMTVIIQIDGGTWHYDSHYANRWSNLELWQSLSK